MEKHEIEYDGMYLTVWGYYEPAEPMVWRYADGSGYPGSPAIFDIQEVYENGCDITEDLTEWDLEQIENLILEIR